MPDNDNSKTRDGSDKIREALEKGFKSGGDIGDIGGGTGTPVSSGGGGRGGRGSGTRSEVRRTGSEARAAEQAAEAGLEDTAAQQIVEQQAQEAKKRAEQQREIAIRRKQREIAQQKIGVVERIQRNRQGEVSLVGPGGKYTFPSESRLTFSPEQDERLRGGSSRIGVRERLNEAALKRQERKQAEFAEEYIKGVEQRFIGTRTKQLEKQAEERRRKEMEQRLKTAPLYAGEQLLQKPIRQTVSNIEQPDLSFLVGDKEKPELSVEVQRGIRQQLQEKNIQQTIADEIKGSKEFIKPDFSKRALGRFVQRPKEFVSTFLAGGKEVLTFGFELGAAERKEQELGFSIEERRKFRKEQIVTKITKPEVLTFAGVSALAISGPVIQFAAGSIYGVVKTEELLNKPSLELAGELTFIASIGVGIKTIKAVSSGARSRFYDFRLSRAGIRRGTFNYRQPALEPQGQEIIMGKGGKITKRFFDFKLSKTGVIRDLAAMPQTGRPIVTTQARLRPLAIAGLLEFSGQAPKEFILRQMEIPGRSFKLTEGEYAGIDYPLTLPKKVTVLDFPKPKPTQTKLTQFILETEPKQKFFEITQPGELQGIRYPAGTEIKFIRLKPQGDLGTKRLTFERTAKTPQQLTIRSFTGEQLPSEFLSVPKPKTGSMKPFSRPKPEVKPKEQFVDVKTGDGLITKQKIKAPKIETFAGDVQFKEPSVRFPETKAPSISIVKTFSAPFSLLGARAGAKVDVFTGRKRDIDRLSVPMIDTGRKSDLGLDIGLKKNIRNRFRQEEISIPKIDTDIGITPDTDITLKQDTGTDITFPRIPELDEPPIPDIDKPRKPPEPEEPTDKTPARFKFDFDLGLPKKGSMPAYHAFARFKGRKTRLTERPLPKNKAFNRMSEFVDSTSSTRGSIKKSQKKTQARDTFYRRAEFKFRKKGNSYIEKEQYRKDSVQERGLSPVGFIKKNQARWF